MSSQVKEKSSTGIPIIEANPPIYDKVVKALGPLPKTVVFAYAGMIFNPGGGVITEPLRVHELTHLAQQGKDYDKWWDHYLEDKEFRLSQEVEAFSNEFNCYRTYEKDRNKRVRFLHSCADRLAHTVYGEDFISLSDAFKIIKEHADSGFRNS